MWNEWAPRLICYLIAPWTDSQAYFAAAFTPVTKDICKLPSFFSSSLFKKLDINNTGLVTKFVLFSTSIILLKQHSCMATLSLVPFLFFISWGVKISMPVLPALVYVMCGLHGYCSKYLYVQCLLVFIKLFSVN